MCKGHGIYKCGKCYSCRARKRNDIMIRLTEHYRGLYRHFIQPHIAVMFGVMTFDDNFIPNVNLNLDVVRQMRDYAKVLWLCGEVAHCVLGYFLDMGYAHDVYKKVRLEILLLM